MNWRVFIIVFLLPLTALAQQPPASATVPSPDLHPPVETIPAGPDQITSLRKGQMAPYDGQLFSVDTSIRWGNWLQQYKYRLAWDVTLEQKVCAEEKTYRDSLLTIEKDRSQKTEKALQEGLMRSETARLAAEEELRNPPWYTTTEFGVIIGAVATVAVVAVAVWALEVRASE